MANAIKNAFLSSKLNIKNNFMVVLLLILNWYDFVYYNIIYILLNIHNVGDFKHVYMFLIFVIKTDLLSRIKW